SEEHTSELQSPCNLVCRLLLEKKNSTRPDEPYLCFQAQESEGYARDEPRPLTQQALLAFGVVPSGRSGPNAELKVPSRHVDERVYEQTTRWVMQQRKVARRRRSKRLMESP